MAPRNIAVFPIAECEKYQRYAFFGSRPNPFENMKSADPDAVRIQKVNPAPNQSNTQNKPSWKTVAFEPSQRAKSPSPAIGSSLGKIAGTALILGAAWGLAEGINTGVKYYLRTRKTKNGKLVTERVRR